jgi:outer membrane receptor protein involved in Fe transport
MHQSRIVTATCLAIFGLSLSSFFTTASAQEDQLEEITVTGSRIVRRDFVSNSPIVTVETEQFESKMGLNIESYLNQMPNFNPAQSPVTTQFDVQITPVNSVGVATLSLRGFGPNRNLVLMDGKRPTPINALMVTDVNQIPSAMIERVETITGGASAVYGADAVGGVTNFILRDDFEGLEFDAQYGQTEVGDGEEYRLSAILGTNVADGRGNVTIAMEHYNRDEALNKERDFYTDAWSSPDQGGNFIGFLQGINGYNCAFNCPNATVANALFPNRPAGTTITAPSSLFFGNIGFVSTFYFNPNGTIFFHGSRAGFSKLDQSIIDGQKYTLQNNYDISVTTLTPGAPVSGQQLKYNFTEGYTSGPQERYSFMASGHYDLTDELTFFARGTWAQSKTRTLLAGNNAIFGWEADIPYNAATDSPIDPAAVGPTTTAAQVAAILANPAAFPNPTFCGHGATTNTSGAACTPLHPVPLELAILLEARGNAAGPWIPQWNTDDSWDFRNTYNTNEVWQVESGLRYDLPFRDWTGELYFSHGESSTYNINTGNMSLSRYRALAALPDYGRNARLSGNAQFLVPTAPGQAAFIGTAASTNFGAADITCTSGFYDTYFGGEQRPSQDCVDAINARLQSRTQAQQDVIEVNLQGGLYDLPAGELRGAAGFQYRENDGQFYPDILQSQQSFMDQVVGVYPTGYLDATTSVKDYYVEALIPVLKDLPYLQKFEIETGARYSDYNVAASTWTYKALANAQVNDWLRLRGGYNRATRAPNLGELFLNLQEIFTGGANFGDACGWQSSAPWGASGAMNRPASAPTNPGVPSSLASGQTLAGATSTYLICQAMMGSAAAVTAYYTSAANSGAAGAPFNWILQKGNANLTSEKADTFTAGIVITSPFDNPWLSGLSAAIDWWAVDINDAIQQYSIDYASYLCFGTTLVATAAEAAAQAATPECQLVPRSQTTGGALTATVAYDNLGTIATSGVDFSVNWNSQLADLGFNVPGGVAINVQSTWLDYYETKASPLDFDVQIDWVGSLGPSLTGTNPGAYEYRVFSNFSYFQDNWSVSLRWRHLPSVVSIGRASENAIIANNAAVTAGAPGRILSYVPTTAIEVDDYNVLDLSFNWDINEMFSLRGGIDNVIDFSPKVTAATSGYPGGTTLTAVCGGAPGCVNPTNYSLPSPGLGITSPGYYDTLGRRFFVGMKARF